MNFQRARSNRNLTLLVIASLLLLIVYSRLQTASSLTHHLEGSTVAPDDVEEPKTIQNEEPEKRMRVDEPEIDEEDRCPNPPFGLLNGRTSTIMQLASFPGSGNTWVRHLIQRGSGILTGSVYDDQTIVDEFPAEGVRDATVIAIKTHYPCEACWDVGPPERRRPAREAQSGVVRDYKATIQVLRSPFGAILSDFNHKQSGANHTGLAPLEAFDSKVFDDYVKARIRIWTRHATFYLHEKTAVPDVWLDIKGKPVLLIYYESLKKNTAQEMSKMFAFIKKFSLRDPYLSRMNPEIAGRCSIAKDPVGGFKRSGIKNKPFEKMLPGEGKTVREMVCEYVKDRCEAFWKKDDPEWSC